MIFQSLEGILFGSQACAWTLLCLNHHEWLQVVLCNKACHDYVHERASASSIRLPSDPPPLPAGSTSSTAENPSKAQHILMHASTASTRPRGAVIGSRISSRS